MTIVCPVGHRFTRRIVAGLPTPETMADADDDRVVLAGCDPMDPVDLTCPTCGRIFEWASRWASRRSAEGPGEARPG